MSIHAGLKIEEFDNHVSGPYFPIKDIYGNESFLSPYDVRKVLIVGWVCFLVSWLINIPYYIVHPSAVEMDPLSDDKKKLFMFGKDVFSSGEEEPSLDEVESDYFWKYGTVSLFFNLQQEKRWRV